MALLFRGVLLVSLYTTPVVLLFLFLMPRLSHRYTSRLRCLVWMLVTIRLLIPVQYSLMDLFGSASPLNGLLNQMNQNVIISALQEILADGAGAAGTVEQASKSDIINGSTLAAIWFMGTILFLCGNLIAYHITVKKLKRWSMPVADPFFLRTFEEIKKRFSISGNIGLYSTSRINTPLLVGLIRPCIYLPGREMSAFELSDVLSHELCHYKRNDLWFKLALLLSNAIHWFNPAVYFMIRQTALDIEMACDNDALRGASLAARKQYGLTILSFVEETPSLSAPLTTYFNGGKKQMKTRFHDIISHNKKKTGVLLFLGCALIVLLCGAWSSNRSLAWPVPAFYTVKPDGAYGSRYNGADFHTGVDIGGENIDGAFVIAAEDGTIARVAEKYESDNGYGVYVVIDHGNGLSTLYAQLSRIMIKEGDQVIKGQIIAQAGSSGFTTEPALHFEVRKAGNHVNPAGFIKPIKYDDASFAANDYIKKNGTLSEEWATPFHSVETEIGDLDDGWSIETTTFTATEVISVKHSDEGLFTPEQWEYILDGIAAGRIAWED